MTYLARACLLLSIPTLALGLAACAKSHGSGDDAGTGLGDGAVLFDGAVNDASVDGGRACLDTAPGLRPALPPIDIFPPVSECRTSNDCNNGTQCFGASDFFCGICPIATRDCENDSTCGPTEWCRSAPPSCCGGVDTTCAPRCTQPGGACQDGELCDMTTGHCTRNGCLMLDQACPENHDCDPSRADADALGCARRGCSVDSQCDCGVCVTGTCESQLGVCSFPPP